MSSKQLVVRGCPLCFRKPIAKEKLCRHCQKKKQDYTKRQLKTVDAEWVMPDHMEENT